MKLFSFKSVKTEDPKAKDKSEDFKEATEIVVSPIKEGISVDMRQGYIRRHIVGQKVIVGSRIKFESKKVVKREGDDADAIASFNEFFDDFGIDPNIELEVLETKPKGRVLVTDSTEIKLLHERPNKDGLPSTKIIVVKKLPKLDELIEVDNIEEMKKIARGDYFINRYEDKTKIVYFAGQYYFVKKK